MALLFVFLGHYITCCHIAARVPRKLPEAANVDPPALIKIEHRSKGAVHVLDAAPAMNPARRVLNEGSPGGAESLLQ